MLLMSFDDALTRANFSFMYFLQFYLLKFFLRFFNGEGLNPQTPPSAYATGKLKEHGGIGCSDRLSVCPLQSC